MAACWWIKAVAALAPAVSVAHDSGSILDDVGGKVMAQGDEPDFFDNDAQGDLFGSEPVPAYRPDPDKVARAAAQDIGGSTCRAKTPLGADDRFPLPNHFPPDDKFSARG